MQPLFIQGSCARLFALYHAPKVTPCRGVVLYIHPFAEELNKARRMVALQARALTTRGFGVLLPDLYGCGDSEGEFIQARWDLWLQDIDHCLEWLQQHHREPVVLWGLRLGTILATDFCRQQPDKVARLLLWQPVEEGRRLLSQFLRLRTAATAMAGGRESVEQLRQQLAAGHCVEVAGYELHPDLVIALDGARLLPPGPDCPVDWLALSRSAGQKAIAQPPPSAWKDAGITVKKQFLPGEPFWGTQEVTLAPVWLEATTTALAESP